MPHMTPHRAHPLCAAIALALGGFLSAPGAQAAAVLPLSSLDGSNGFRLDGVALADLSGSAVSAAGDINGDGIDDLIIGAHYGDPNGSNSGSSYVLFGSSNGFPATIELSSLDGSNGFRIDGLGAGELSGFAVSAGGDLNGDGIDDLIIGAPQASQNFNISSGSTYVVFGSSSGFSSALNLSSLNGVNGFRLDGAAMYDGSGRSVSAAGDVNGDGVDDLIIGAPFANPNGTDSGSSYVVFGRSAGGFASVINLASLDGSNGFRLDGEAFLDRSGLAVSGAGDINGDGIDDLIIGTPYANWNGTNSGSSYVVFGRSTAFASIIELSSLDGITGFRLDGESFNVYSGRAVSAAGDVNGDGIDDLIIGAYRASRNGSNSGSTYVVFGRSTGGFAPVINLSSLDGNTGFRLDGTVGGDYSGFAVSAAGDVNGDGIDDFIIGAHLASPTGSFSGASYLVFGRSNGFASAINLSSLDGSSGIRINGVAARDYSGRAVSAAGDINGDGIDDLIIGAPGADPNGNYSGSSYVVFGNAAPLLEAGASSVIESLEDDSNSAGGDLASLVVDVYLDADPFAGAALDIDAPVSVHGEWQFRPDAAEPWSPMPSGLSSSNALLLAPDASLRFVPVADFFGSIAPLSLRLWDGADAALYSFGPGQDIRQSIGSLGGFSNDANRLPVSAEILPVNDAPGFTASNPPSVVEGAGAQTVAGWVTDFNPGPANESDQQVLEYIVSAITHPTLFAAPPSVDVDGNLSYTVAAGAAGSSDFTLQVRDDGGTANGGVDISAPQVFTITVLSNAIFCDGFESVGCP